MKSEVNLSSSALGRGQSRVFSFHWPRSLPDYKWPVGALTWRRRMGAGVFHLCHVAGRCVSFLAGNNPRALVIRTDGIGDAMLGEPMLGGLARKLGDGEIHLWAPAATCELFRATPHVQRAMIVPRGFKAGSLAILNSVRWRAALGYRLGRWKFSVAIYPAHSPEPVGNWLFASVRAKQRWYSPGNTENQFAGQRAATMRRATGLLGQGEATVTSQHELARNAELASQWGGNISGVLPTVHLDENARATAAIQAKSWRQIAAWLEGTAIVGVMPATAEGIKKYPAGAWGKVVAELWSRHRIICALLGGAEDARQLGELSLVLGKTPHLKMARPLDLLSMAALIGSLDGLISVDTGLAHIALAQEISTVALVGGGHPNRFFPWPQARHAITLTHSMPCQGCLGRCHLQQAECITRIDPEQIVRGMEILLKREMGTTIAA